MRQIVQALDPAPVTLALEGPVSYRDKHELVFRRRTERPNQTWQSDHIELDILIVGADRKPDRPWLTTVMDDYSRAICGYMVFTGAPSAINTALALRQAIWRKTDPAWAMCDIPDILHVDPGSDFVSHHLAQTAVALHIRIIHSTVGRPQGRGKIEQFFGTVNTELLATLPGLLGPGGRTPTPVLDLAGLARAISEFIGTYNGRPHSELGISPRDAWVADGWLPRMPDSLQELDGLLFTVPKNRVVQRDGIHFQGQRYLASTLAPFVGHTITIRYDPRDISEIRVEDRDTFICTAIDEAHPNLRLSVRDIETDRCHPRGTSHPRTQQAAAEAAHLRRGRVMNQAFIVTKEHRRFIEFANAVRKEKTIGICHAAGGVGKTNSARRYVNWDALEAYVNEWGPRGEQDAPHYALANRSRTVFYTPEVLCTPKTLMNAIMHWQIEVGICADERLRSLSPEAAAEKQHDVTRFVEILIIDEAERLTPTALELLRDQHDRTHRAMILIGMPGIDERFRHYPQLYSRLGFSHQSRALGREELLFVLDRHWKRPGRTLDPDDFTDAQAIAAIERITRGNFRLLERLFPQINRVLKINQLDTITDDVIEAAGSILVVGN